MKHEGQEDKKEKQKNGGGGPLAGERQLNSFEGEWKQLGSIQRDFCHSVGRVWG